MEERKAVMTNEHCDEQTDALKRLLASGYPHPILSVTVHRCDDGRLLCSDARFYGGGRLHYAKSPATMPKETNTYLYVDELAVWGSDAPRKAVRVSTYKYGNRRNDLELMSAIEDVQVLNDRVIMVKFSDGTTEKAVLDESDTFSVEQGIAICLTKKLLSTLTRGNGGSVYNKLVEYGVKTYEAIEAHKAEVAKEKTEKAAKAKRDAEKAQRKKERKVAEQREADIEIQKEAYLRAMRELNADK